MRLEVGEERVIAQGIRPEEKLWGPYQFPCPHDLGDRSALANVKIDDPSFHEWDGAGNNPELLAVSKDTALLFYSDFYYPDPEGVKRKSVLCREIKVLKD